MYTKLKLKLALIFTVIVITLQLITAVFFIYYEISKGDLVSNSISSYISILLLEISVITFLTFTFGYYFVAYTLNPAIESHERLEEFTSDASHEMKTPITVALSNLELALKTKEYSKYITKAKINLHNTSLLINKLLELTQIDQTITDKTEVNLKEIVELVIQNNQTTISAKKLKLELDIKDNDIKADHELVISLIKNLIDNAIKYSNQGGNIRIFFDKNIFRIENSITKSIPSISLTRLKNRFYKANKEDQFGFGIGLSISEAICKAHGWKLLLESPENKFVAKIRM